MTSIHFSISVGPFNPEERLNSILLTNHDLSINSVGKIAANNETWTISLNNRSLNVKWLRLSYQDALNIELVMTLLFYKNGRQITKVVVASVPPSAKESLGGDYYNIHVTPISIRVSPVKSSKGEVYDLSNAISRVKEEQKTFSAARQLATISRS